MTENLKQIIEEELMKLPKELQEAVRAFDWITVSSEIGKKYLLTEDQINAFQAETSLVLIGIEDEYSYTLNLKNNVGIEINTAEKITSEILERILEPIANIMQEGIKKNLNNLKPKLDEDLNFILSGGDYSAFMNKGEVENEDSTKTIGSSNILETKNKLIN